MTEDQNLFFMYFLVFLKTITIKSEVNKSLLYVKRLRRVKNNFYVFGFLFK